MPRGRRDLSGAGRHACLYKGCGKRFHRSYNLKVHQRVHTGDRPYICTYPRCERKFAWKASLDSHKLSHNKSQCENSVSLTAESDKRQTLQPSSPCTSPRIEDDKKEFTSPSANQPCFEFFYVQNLDYFFDVVADGTQGVQESREALQETGVISFVGLTGQMS
eukprot:Plantae.Rhodophyta-Purpureofilum_apyrenoidigerum.ctg28491.p1 GENE.Plantae.Rhodophyta-Purpureofilum_apyrenoidigerum.ctg28491~~Plantae.Rhodophyta-Purpureofilum_apyrenoidigerum.ctg28491.p1  ORF type:complete len:163 (-),score=8.61 Plantae.Rhodophyta-Purpureofilum_apyrenoidigerum.ctg28491:283-771(-)